jgi:hypothetical protein
MKFIFIFIFYFNLNVDLTIEIILKIKIDPKSLGTLLILAESGVDLDFNLGCKN